jgi:hypothetical protein
MDPGIDARLQRGDGAGPLQSISAGRRKELQFRPPPFLTPHSRPCKTPPDQTLIYVSLLETRVFVLARYNP